jgi:hypothetical protein
MKSLHMIRDDAAGSGDIMRTCVVARALGELRVGLCKAKFLRHRVCYKLQVIVSELDIVWLVSW